MTCQDTTMSLGVYLLGALDDDERAEVEAHLESCAACRDELAQLEGLPALLSRLTIEDVSVEPLTVPDDLFERVAAQARAEDAKRHPSQLVRYRRLMAVAAAVVLLVAGGVSWAALHSSPGPHPPSGISAQQKPFVTTQHGVRMSVTLAAQTTGTGLTVTVSGLPKDEHCRLIAVAKDGTRDVAGRWDATYSGWAQQTGSTTIPQSQLSQLVLLGTGGKNLVTVPV